MTEYGIMAVEDELPATQRGPGSRQSPLNDEVEKVIADPALVGKAVCIAVYEKSTTCAGAANSLRSRYGRKADVRGLEFATRKQSVRENGEVVDRHGLWVVYDPARVVDGALEQHQSVERERAMKQREKAAEAKAAAKGQG